MFKCESVHIVRFTFFSSFFFFKVIYQTGFSQFTCVYLVTFQYEMVIVRKLKKKKGL